MATTTAEFGKPGASTGGFADAKEDEYQKYLDLFTAQATKDIPDFMKKEVAKKVKAQFDKMWAEKGFKVPLKPGTPEDSLDKILTNAQQTREENQKIIDEWLSTAKPQLAEAGGTANEAEQAAIDKLEAAMPGAIKAGKVQKDISSKAAGAEASKESIAYQNEALRKLSGLTSPTVTAKERFLEYRARQQEEQDRKAAVDAALNDLSRRGIRSGGAEIGALTGAQQTTSQNRLMQDLGTNAGAVDRAMRAIEGLGTLSSTARGQSFNEEFQTGTAADDISKFNTTQRADYQKWLDNFKAGQANDVWGRNRDIASAQTTGVKDAYGRTQDEINLGQAGAGMKVGASTQGSQQTGDALKTGLGYEMNLKAIESLKPKGGLFGTGIGPDFSI